MLALSHSDCRSGDGTKTRRKWKQNCSRAMDMCVHFKDSGCAVCVRRSQTQWNESAQPANRRINKILAILVAVWFCAGCWFYFLSGVSNIYIDYDWQPTDDAVVWRGNWFDVLLGYDEFFELSKI